MRVPPIWLVSKDNEKNSHQFGGHVKEKKHSHTCLTHTHTKKTHTFLPQSGQAAWTSRIRRRAALLALKARADEKAGVD